MVVISKSVMVFDISASRSCAAMSVWRVIVVPPVRDTSLLIMSPFWM